MLTDKDVMDCALTSLKHLSHVYHGLSEHVGNAYLLREVSQIMNEKQELRLRVFQAMNQRGWYNPRLIDNQQIQQHIQSMSQQLGRLQQQVSGTQAQAQANPYPTHQGQAPGVGFQANRPVPQQSPWTSQFRP